MKPFYLLLITFCTFHWAGAQNITFQDPKFKNALLNHTPAIDTNSDSEISIAEAAAVTSLIVNSSSISDLTREF